jgi:D-xylose transport system substrate-binding protein
VTVPQGRVRLVAFVATLLTAGLPAIAWAQSPSALTSPVPTVVATQATPSAAPSTAPSTSAPGASPSAAASPGGSPAATPLWTPPAASGPVALLTAGLEGDARAAAITDAFRTTLAESCPQATLDASTADTAEAQAQQAADAIAGDATVLVLDPVDPAAAASIVSDAQAAGLSVVALGDTVTGAVPDLQVAYDPPATGSLIGAVVVAVATEAAQSGDDATPVPSDVPVEQVVLVDGPEGDASLAAWSAKVKEGLGSGAAIVHEAAVTELTAVEGKRVIEEAIAALTTDGFGAVITPGDAVAAGVIAGLGEAGVDPAAVSVTGLGGTLPGTQAVVAGDQLLTTWSPDAPAASVAAALACGEVTGLGLPEGLTATPVANGTGDVPTVLLTAILVTDDGSVTGTRSVDDTLIAGEAFGPDTVGAICTSELAVACDDLGIVLPSASPGASGSPGASASPIPGTSAAPSPASGSPGASGTPAGSPVTSSPAASPAASTPPASPGA